MSDKRIEDGMSGFVVCPNCETDVTGMWLNMRDTGEPDYRECSICPHCEECIFEDDWEIIEDEPNTPQQEQE